MANTELSLAYQGADPTPERIEWNELNDWADVTSEQKLIAYEWVGSMHDVQATSQTMNMSTRKIQSKLRHPWIRAFISHLESQLKFTSILSRAWLEQEWLEQYRRLTGEIPVPFVNRDGDEFGVRKFHPAEVVSALKEIGKLVDAYPASGGASVGSGDTVVNIDLRALGIGLADEVLPSGGGNGNNEKVIPSS